MWLRILSLLLVSFYSLTVAAQSAPSIRHFEWFFIHTIRDRSVPTHTDQIIRYKDQDGTNQEASIINGQFMVAPESNLSNKTTVQAITYQTWGGAVWKAEIIDHEFFKHTSVTYTGGSHKEEYINYITWNGTLWNAYLAVKEIKSWLSPECSNSFLATRFSYCTPPWF